ncbi:voltage-dependent T-type calcium channel subunit alpha-1H-like [Stegastes partitus]|uniref:Voltage-dependent T-type calcium channel subunit alpha-1H-like n=1 Tax=Stegastes partitus TaxID=144197 RepID=A0A9Y4NGR4_9TELE|nr:PREDICTED: voltage-dependent T-type calcium channel subunit alpha-1H-like [Stegastes partitus]
MKHCKDIPAYHDDGKTCTLVPLNSWCPNEFVPAVVGETTDACVNWNAYYNVCRAGDHNPHMGAINFDNIGYAWITVFQVMTLKGWTNIMGYFMDSSSFWSFSYFLVATILGTTFIVNVCGVIIASHFSEIMERDRGEQDADAVSIKNLFSKVTSWLSRAFHCLIRCQDRVFPAGIPMETNGTQILKDCQRKLKVAVHSDLFKHGIMVAVLLNVITMAIEYHEQPKELTIVLQYSSICFTVLFFLEMILKLLALSLAYFEDRDNIFEFVLVIISLCQAAPQLSGVQALLVLRFWRLVFFIPYLRRELMVLMRTAEKSTALCWLMLIFLFLFGVPGMHLFGWRSIPGYSQIIGGRKYFDTLLQSMVTVFQILTLEEWHKVAYISMASTSAWAMLYFAVIILIGHHVLLNVFGGIVLQCYQAMQLERAAQEATEQQPADPTRPEQDNPEPTSVEETVPADDNASLSLTQRVRRWCREREDWSLYLFSPQNRFRVFCQWLISHTMFDIIVLLFISLSCITVVMERPAIHPDSMERWILQISTYIFSAVFLVEMFVKVVALGLLIGRESYCRSAWNVIDGVLVITSFIHILIEVLTPDNSNMLTVLTVFRLVRTLRLLRALSRVPKLKQTMEALMTSFKPLGNITLICCIIFLFYGIFGLQLFKGKFYHCVGHDLRNITNKTDCLAANYSWVGKQLNFDNLLQAVLSVFVMFTKDGWVNIMYDGLDAVGVDQQPVQNYNEWMLLYFIPFMVMSYFLLNMFIGISVETFQKCQREQRQVAPEREEEAQDQHAGKKSGEASLCEKERLVKPQKH